MWKCWLKGWDVGWGSFIHVFGTSFEHAFQVNYSVGCAGVEISKKVVVVEEIVSIERGQTHIDQEHSI